MNQHGPIDPDLIRDGLRFTCTECGQCCTGEPGYVYVTDEEIAAIARLLDVPEDEFRARATRPAPGGTSLKERANGDCIFLRGTRCLVYEARPTQCRTYPFWPANLASAEAWNAAAADCPGIGEGRRWTADEILARARPHLSGP